MQITFIRHSQTIFEPAVPNERWVLSKTGVEEAEKLAKTAWIKELDVIYSSLQNKALETAVILAKPHRCKVKTRTDLNELSSIYKGFIENYDEDVERLHIGEIKRINGGETIEEGYQRFKKAVDDIAKLERSGRIGIVSHGNILSIYVSKYSHYSSLDIHRSIEMPDVAIMDYPSMEFKKLFNKLEND